MTNEQLGALIYAGERLEVEFKGEQRAPLSDREIIETVVCLSNRPGMDRKAGYVRQRGFEPIQQARNLLARLTARGDLILKGGSRRGAYYETASKPLDASKTGLDASNNIQKSPKRK